MIKAIFIANEQNKVQHAVKSIELEVNKGIVADRHYDKHWWPGQNLTLIESEQINFFNQNYNQNIAIDDTRRNIITSSIRLNELVGKKFTLGDALLYGVELCQPCRSLGESLAKKCSITKHDIIKALTGRAGLRASVLKSGHCSVGMPIHTVEISNEQ